MSAPVATPPEWASQFSTIEQCFNCGLQIRRETFNGGEPWLHGYRGNAKCDPAFVRGVFAQLVDRAGAAAHAEKTNRHMDGYPREDLTRARIAATEELRKFCVANKETICR